uniref:Major facilitator superfamily domain-containing protein 12-like n=1 Tax=Solanum tuberosum TaxID=4113 RepID=M1C4U1_SOLTU
MVNEMVDDEPKSLGRCSVFTYGVGHMLNDITSSCCNAATVTLTGQFADAFMTIIAGELIDRFGHFKIWHVMGCLLVALSFTSLFGGCLPCKILGSDSPVVQTAGYCISAVIFCSGWSCTQISHMSMVNGVTLNPESRVACVSCRNAFTMYQLMVYISIFIGAVFVIIFQLGTKEPSLKQESNGKRATASWTYWLKKVLYYQVLSIYVLTRAVTNVSQIPAIIYLSSFVASVLLQELKWSGERLKAFFSAGGLLCLFCGTAIIFLPINMHAFMYVLSILIGIANALMMVTAIGMESELVDEDLDGSAFVYGSLGFIDKVLCGVFLYFLESYESKHLVPLSPCTS